MAFEIKPGNMWLHKNEKHQKGDNQPCLKGDVNINGIIYEVAVWAPKEGKKAYFGIVKPKEAQPPEAQQQTPAPVQQEPDLPF